MITVSAMGLNCPLGCGLSDIAASLRCGVSPGMRSEAGELGCGWTLCLGHAADPGGKDEVPAQLCEHASANNRLLLSAWRQLSAAAEEAARHCGPGRFGIILGTSTSGLAEADRYISSLRQGRSAGGYRYAQQELGDPARFLSALMGSDGPAYTISTACTSSMAAVSSAMALMEAGVIDAALTGGCDTLNRMTISGFASLGLLSAERCMPFCRDRRGITIGEAAGLMLLTRGHGPLYLAGAGHGSDACHMSAPHPGGRGAREAIARALNAAGLAAGDIGYLSLHGTGTQLNDAVEAAVVSDLFAGTPCSSLKHLTGHTLGAAGICALILACLILRDDMELPAQDFARSPRDEKLPPCRFVEGREHLHRDFVLCNAMAFGGSCAAVIAGRC